MKNKYYVVVFGLAITLFLVHIPASSQTGSVQTIYFKPNSFAIDKKYRQSLDLVISQINSDTFSYLKVFGYADRSGSDAYNDILSKKRAIAVYDYLAARVRLDSTKVYVTWLGESDAGAYDLHFPSAKIRQRCVDIWITYYLKADTGNFPVSPRP